MTALTIYLLACYFIIIIAMVMHFHDVATLQSETAIFMAYDNDMDLTKNYTEAKVVVQSFRMFATSRRLL